MTAVEGMERANELASKGANSMGEAMKAQGIWADSLEGKLQNLQGVAQEFWINFINSDVVKAGIDGLTLVLEILNTLQDTFGSLGLSLGILGGAFVGFTNNGIKDTFLNMAEQMVYSDKTMKDLIKTEKSYISIKKVEKDVTLASGVATKASATTMSVFGVAVDLTKIKVIALQMAMTMGLMAGITLVIGGISKFVGSLMDSSSKMGMLSKDMQEFNEQSRQNSEELGSTITSAKAVQSEINRLDSAISQTDNLEERASLTKQLVEQQAKMGEILPDTVTDLDEHSRGLSKNNEYIKASIALKEKELQLEAQSWFEKNKNIEAMQQQAQSNMELLKTMELAKAQGKNSYDSDINNQFATGDAQKMGGGNKSKSFTSEDMKLARDQIEQTIEVTKDAIANYDRLSSTQRANLGVTREELQLSLDSLAKMVTEADTFNTKLEDTVSTAKDIAQEMSSIKDEMDGANNKAELLAKAMKEYADTQTLSYDTQKKMLESGDEEIIRLLGQKNEFMTIANQLYDEEITKRDTSMQQMIVLAQMESEKQRLEAEGFSESARLLDAFINASNGAYSTDLQNFRLYQQGKAQADEVTIKALASWLSNLVGGNVQAYEADLRNTRNWAETKSLILRELDQNMVKIQSQLDSTYQKMNELANSGIEDDMGLYLQFDKHANRLQDRLDKIGGSAQDIKTDFSNIGTDFIGMSDPLSSGKGSGGKGGSSAKKDPEYTAKLEQWYNLKDAINDTNVALESNRRLQERADDREKVVLMEKEIELIEKQISLKKQLQSEMEKEKKKLQDQIKARGGVFEGDNLINGDSILGSAKGEKSVENMKALRIVLVKPFLIDLELQRWTTRGKFKYSLNDLTKWTNPHMVCMRKSEHTL